MNKKRVFSGIKPSGDLHLGNYIGALSQWVKSQDLYESFFCIVDLHAITAPIEPKALSENTRSAAAWYLASGIDPKKSTIFLQSQNKDHAYLGWILNCYTGMGQLNRMTQYKDKRVKTSFVSVGLFDYPVLMAADILLYDAELVPVGEDQKQHIELARDLVKRFNDKHGRVFTMPEYMPPPTGERIMSLQNPMNKMSKSETDPMGTINLSDKRDDIIKKFKAAVTDSGNEVRISKSKPAVSNLVKIFMSLSGQSEEEISKKYSGKGYKVFKDDLAELAAEKFGDLQEKYNEALHSKKIDDVLEDGLQKASVISSKKVEKVRALLGLR